MDDIEVPNVYGLTEDKAKKAFEQKKLINYKFTTVASETVEEGKVVYTDPKAGSVVGSDSQITIYISSGPTTAVVETITVPDVIGLEKCGFKNISFVTEDSMAPKGVVLSQSPNAGVSAQAEDSIKITISSGVTTTTTVKTYKAALTVRLPEITSESDTLIIELDGKSYSSNKVKLDGSEKTFSIQLDNTGDMEIRVSLKSTGAVQTERIKGDRDQNVNIDFSSFSVTKEPSSTETDDDSGN